MDVTKAIKKRRSIRKFLDKNLPEDAIEILTDAIRWAPSAGNLQARRFYFIFEAGLKKRIAEAALNQMFIASAPLVIIACADYERIMPYGKRGKELYTVQDVSCAVENLMLQACELGLGTVWVGAFDEDEVVEILKLPYFLKPLAIIPVGYPAENPTPPERFEKEEIIEIIKYA